MIQFAFFFVWLCLMNIIAMKLLMLFPIAVVYVLFSFLFSCSTAGHCLDVGQFISSTADGFGYYDMNILVWFWGEYVHLFYLGLYLVMESLGDRLGRVSFIRYGHTIFQNGCTTLSSDQQYPRVPSAPCPHYSEFHLPFTYGLWGSILLALPHLLSHF